MANIEHFTHDEIPYGILAKFGLSQEMIDDLPNNVMNRLLSSRATPVLPIVTENAEGEKVQSLARISLVRLNNGTIDICFAPRWEDEDLSEFTPEQQEKLKLGEVTIANMVGRGDCYIQFDDTINQVMAVPVAVINQNIKILTQSFDLDDEDQQILKNGDILEKDVNDYIVSVGIDLNEMAGIRIVDGDTTDWKRDAAADRLPKYNFGIFGCWMADDENVLTYIQEDDYTEEIILEQKRIGQQNAAEENMRQLKVG